MVCRAFDVDLLHIAEHFSVPVSEVAVNWHEIPGVYIHYCLWCILSLTCSSCKSERFKENALSCTNWACGCYKGCGMAMTWLGRRSCDQELASLTYGSSTRQFFHMRVPLSAGSITYWEVDRESQI